MNTANMFIYEQDNSSFFALQLMTEMIGIDSPNIVAQRLPRWLSLSNNV